MAGILFGVSRFLQHEEDLRLRINNLPEDFFRRISIKQIAVHAATFRMLLHMFPFSCSDASKRRRAFLSLEAQRGVVEKEVPSLRRISKGVIFER